MQNGVWECLLVLERMQFLFLRLVAIDIMFDLIKAEE